MSETAILGTVIGVLWGLVLALIGVTWSTLRERIAAGDAKVLALEKQNTMQEAELARLSEQVKATSQAQSRHREDIDGRLDRIEGKLDRLLSGGGRSYSPGSYPEQRPIKREDPTR